MSVPPHNQITPGTSVSIVLKQDQRTGRQVQGKVSQVLTRGNHPRGVKVRLSDGRIGRVQRLVEETSSDANTAPSQKKYYRKMADHNPWADDESSRAPPHGQNQGQGQGQNQNQGYPQGRFYADSGPQQQSYQQPQYQSYHQTPQQPPQGQGAAQEFYNNGHNHPQDQNAWTDQSGNPPLPARNTNRPNVSAQGINRSDTDELLAQQTDRAEQLEYMQNYEATATQSPDDVNRAKLEREFPDVDGSLIAALYSDTQDYSATREMLQELNRK